MPYDYSEVARQIAATLGQAQTAHTTRAEAAQDAGEIYLATDDTEWQTRIEAVQSRRLLGVPRTPLHEFTPGEPADPDYTVIATDSSFVAPDKHRGSYCYLINVGRVMIQYGEESAAELDSTATHCIDPPLDGAEWSATGPLLQAECALQELTELHRWAEQFGADLALFDGSLMQLSLALARDPKVAQIVAAYGAVLADFERIGVPVVGYVSKPASQAVMRVARVLACRAAGEGAAQRVAPCETRCSRTECSGLWTLDDSGLFWELLDVGVRSPVFQNYSPYSSSGGQRSLDFWDTMGFCYLATPYEVARLEFPLWVEQADLLDRTQRIVLSQCALGDGYPKALTLADNFAVLRAADRASYFYLLEQAGLLAPPSEKARGKRGMGRRI
ncbi:MAG: DNA double-strand break repair nuclease NurA [Chloroflexota bacterium]|nr:DNA double-strand break repair nuclease NurA [Chloroflexota bacterium]